MVTPSDRVKCEINKENIEEKIKMVTEIIVFNDMTVSLVSVSFVFEIQLTNVKNLSVYDKIKMFFLHKHHRLTF